MFPIAPCSGAALDVVFGVATLVVLYALGAESLGANVRVHHGALGMVRALFVARMRGKEAVALGFLHSALVGLLRFVIESQIVFHVTPSRTSCTVLALTPNSFAREFALWWFSRILLTS